MTQPTTIKGGKVRVLLGNVLTPGVYSAPCGFSSRSLSLAKELNDVKIPDCDDPDAIDWVGRDAVSLSMSFSGDGVLASESVDTWLDAFEDVNSVPVKVEWEFPAKTITWTGAMHIDKLDSTADNGQRATLSIGMQSDGQMVRTST